MNIIEKAKYYATLPFVWLNSPSKTEVIQSLKQEKEWLEVSLSTKRLECEKVRADYVTTINKNRELLKNEKLSCKCIGPQHFDHLSKMVTNLTVQQEENAENIENLNDSNAKMYAVAVEMYEYISAIKVKKKASSAKKEIELLKKWEDCLIK